MQLIATLTHLAAEMQRTRAAQSSIRRILTKGVFQLKSPEAALAPGLSSAILLPPIQGDEDAAAGLSEYRPAQSSMSPEAEAPVPAYQSNEEEPPKHRMSRAVKTVCQKHKGLPDSAVAC